MLNKKYKDKILILIIIWSSLRRVMMEAQYSMQILKTLGLNFYHHCLNDLSKCINLKHKMRLKISLSNKNLKSFYPTSASNRILRRRRRIDDQKDIFPT